VKDEQHEENVNIRLYPNRWKGAMQQTQSTLVETVSLNGHKVEIRRYKIGEKIEFRFPWRDPGGKRHFTCCRSQDEARQAAQEFCSGSGQVEPPTASAPVKAPKLTPELLAELARVFHLGTVQTFNQTLAEVCDEFMTAQKGKLDREQIRPETYRGLKSRIPDLKGLLGKVNMGDLTVERMDKSFGTIKLSPRSISNVRDTLGAVLRWAVNRTKAPDAVLKEFKNMTVTGSRKKDSEKIDPFTRCELLAVLNEAMENKFDPTKTNYRMVAVIALQAFGGLRAAEACKLPWGQIDLNNGVIRVTADIAKTKQSRAIEILPCLRLWLETVPLQDRIGAVYGGFAYSKARGRLARRVARKLEGFQWRDNALRQAFIANYISFADSISRTAYLAGTSEAKIRAHYWKLVSKADAVAYFATAPSRP